MNPPLATLMLGTLLIFAMSGCSGCGQSPEERAVQDFEDAAEELEDAFGEGAEDFADAMGAFGEALGGAMGADGDGEDYEPVERQALRDVMPESVNGMDRTSIESTREGFGGITMTRANAEYQGGEGRFELTVTDLAGMPFAGIAAMGWAGVEIDRETDTEIERTFEFEGNRAMEKYDSSTNSGEISVMAHGFHIEGRGYNMSRDQIHDAMGDAPISELGRLR